MCSSRFRLDMKHKNQQTAAKRAVATSNLQHRRGSWESDTSSNKKRKFWTK